MSRLSIPRLENGSFDTRKSAESTWWALTWVGSIVFLIFFSWLMSPSGTASRSVLAPPLFRISLKKHLRQITLLWALGEPSKRAESGLGPRWRERRRFLFISRRTRWSRSPKRKRNFYSKSPKETPKGSARPRFKLTPSGQEGTKSGSARYCQLVRKRRTTNTGVGGWLAGCCKGCEVGDER